MDATFKLGFLEINGIGELLLLLGVGIYLLINIQFFRKKGLKLTINMIKSMPIIISIYLIGIILFIILANNMLFSISNVLQVTLFSSVLLFIGILLYAPIIAWLIDLMQCTTEYGSIKNGYKYLIAKRHNDYVKSRVNNYFLFGENENISDKELLDLIEEMSITPVVLKITNNNTGEVDRIMPMTVD